MNLSLVENYINKSIEKIPENAINGKNVLLPLIQYQNLNCGVLVIQKK
jgi:hypothetical protein